MRQEHEISTVTPNPRTHSSINAIFTTEFIAARGEHLTGNRAFRYINIVGVNEEEAVLAESRSARHLTMLLRHRGLDQFTKLSRPSLVARALVGRARESRTDTSSNQKPSHQSAAIQTTGHQKKNVDMNIDPASTPIH